MYPCKADGKSANQLKTCCAQKDPNQKLLHLYLTSVGGGGRWGGGGGGMIMGKKTDM